jgi:hypothetical protein
LRLNAFTSSSTASNSLDNVIASSEITSSTSTGSIRFDGIDKNSDDSMGIFELVYLLDYDRETFIPTGISPSGYKSLLFY